MQDRTQDRSHTRVVIGIVLAVLTVPLLILGLMDPMEGGLAMLLAGALIVATRYVSQVHVPRLEWVAWAATAIVGVAAVIAGTLLWQAGITGPGLPIPWWVWVLIGAYEIGVVATLAGGVQYLVRLVGTVRHPRNAAPLLQQ
jgi:drug/metabolite transporter (DMT)-like permease